MKKNKKIIMLLMTVIMLSQIFFSSSMSFGAQIVGDINNDSVVNMQDVLIIAKAFNTTKGQPYYDLTCDLNNDGMINMGDILKLAVNFNKSADDYPTSDDQPANVTYEYDGVDGEYIYCNNPEGINNTTHYLADHGEVIYKTQTHGKRYVTVFMQHLGGEGVGRLKFGVLLTNNNFSPVNIRISNQMFGGMKELTLLNHTPTNTVDYQNITRTNDYRKYFGGTINNPIDVYGDVIDGKLDTKITSGYNGTTDIKIPSGKSIWLMGGPSTVEEFFNEGKMEMGFVNGMAKFEKPTNLDLEVKVVAYTSSNLNAVKTAKDYPGWTSNGGTYSGYCKDTSPVLKANITAYLGNTTSVGSYINFKYNCLHPSDSNTTNPKSNSGKVFNSITTNIPLYQDDTAYADDMLHLVNDTITDSSRNPVEGYNENWANWGVVYKDHFNFVNNSKNTYKIQVYMQGSKKESDIYYSHNFGNEGFGNYNELTPNLQAARKILSNPVIIGEIEVKPGKTERELRFILPANSPGGYKLYAKIIGKY